MNRFIQIFLIIRIWKKYKLRWSIIFKQNLKVEKRKFLLSSLAYSLPTAYFGSFYDALTDSFITGIKLFNQTIPDSLITTTYMNPTDYSYNFEDTMSSKFEKLEISGALKLSILAGLISAEGSAKYLNEKKKSFKSVKATMIYNSRH